MEEFVTLVRYRFERYELIELLLRAVQCCKETVAGNLR